MDVDPQVRVQLPTTDIERAPGATGVGGRSKVARQIGHEIEGVDQLNMILGWCKLGSPPLSMMGNRIASSLC